MLTYEKVLEIFKDYLEQDKEIEVLVSRRGHVLIEWAGSFDFLDGGRLCSSPEDLFDALLDSSQGYEEILLTKGRRELTPEDTQKAKAKCLPYLEKRREAEMG